MTGWHDLVSMRILENVMGEVGNDASCSATEKGGGGLPRLRRMKWRRR